MNIIDRQTFVISVNCFTFVPGPPEVPSQVTLPMNLRFAADELILKSISYHPLEGKNDLSDTVQIWCNKTNDGLIGSFSNSNNFTVRHDEHFRISNTFQSGNFVLQFQGTDGGGPASYNPQPLISSQVAQRTFGTVVLTIEFVKLLK